MAYQEIPHVEPAAVLYRSLLVSLVLWMCRVCQSSAVERVEGQVCKVGTRQLSGVLVLMTVQHER